MDYGFRGKPFCDIIPDSTNNLYGMDIGYRGQPFVRAMVISASGNIKSMNGILRASIKSINGISFSSVKSAAGIVD